MASTNIPKVPKNSTVETLKRALLAAKSVSYSQAGQSGIHFAKIIDQLGIGDAVRAKAVINASGLVDVRIRFANPKGQIRPGAKAVIRGLAASS